MNRMTENIGLPKEEFENRIKRTQELLRGRGLDGLIAFSSYAEREGHVCYLTNHHITFPNAMSHTGLGYAAFVLPADGMGVLVSPLGYQEDVVVGIDYAKTGFNLVSDLVSAIKEKNLDDKKIGIAGLDVIPVEYYHNMKQLLPSTIFYDANNILESQRIVKSTAELELLRKAARIADEGLMVGMEAAEEGVKEYEIELVVRKAALDAGADFIPRVRVSSGKRITTLTWPMAKDKRLKKGEFVYIDLIGWYKNYGFDNSRVKVLGTPTKEQRDFLETVVDATQWMIKVLKPKVQIHFVFTMARGKSIIPIAHGIGIEITENPWITIGRRFKLMPNMVLCVEPIVVSTEFGGVSIEDTVVVTEKGVKVLNKCPKILW